MKASRLGLRQSDLEEIVNVLNHYESISEAILFGSRAKGNHTNGSDIDIALKGDIDFKTMTKLRYVLNQETMMPYKFDLINYARLNHLMLKEHIDRVGIVIYTKDMLVSA